MDAGRELDAAVAEKVFGEPFRNGPEAVPDPEGKMAWVDKPRTPHYSTDWRAAGEVIEKLKAEGWCIVVDDGPDSTDCFCGPRPGLHEEWLGNAVANTGPHAICLAALAAAEETP